MIPVAKNENGNIPKPFIGRPTAGHCGYFLNVPTPDGWVVINCKTMTDIHNEIEKHGLTNVLFPL